MSLGPGPEKWAYNKLMPLDIWRLFFINEINADILVYTSNKICNVKSEFPD